MGVKKQNFFMTPFRSFCSSHHSRISIKIKHLATQQQRGKWKGLDTDCTDDQIDIARGRNMVDTLYQGGSGLGGTHNSILDVCSEEGKGIKNLDSLDDEYYLSPKYSQRLSLHIVKNYIDLQLLRCPLILGIWGGKGQGKTFQAELGFKRMKICTIVMSAGELESGNAGEPAKMIRERYRQGSSMVKKGKLSCLFINDIDAGAGRMDGTTQYTVNNQLVNATLMNISDCPDNDFSTLYSPLIRDGRMDKYYWRPSRDDLVGICEALYSRNGMPRQAIETFVDSFPEQSVDFFCSVRSRIYDKSIREMIHKEGVENLESLLLNHSNKKVSLSEVVVDLRTILDEGICFIIGA